MKLLKNEVHLWVSFPDKIQESTLLRQYESLISDEEKKHQQRLRMPQHRHQYLITRVLIRTVLSKYLPYSPEKWCFTKNAYGKPEIFSEMNDSVLPVRFNISHSQGIIVCAVRLKKDIGIDIENIQRQKVNINIAKRFFSITEAKALSNLPEAQRYARFFDYWVLKEAYIKAKGMGLSLPLEQFSYHFLEKKKISLTFDTQLKDNPQHWQFLLFQLSKQYKGALVIQQKQSESYQIKMKKIIPLQEEINYAYHLLAKSVYVPLSQ